MKDWKRLFYFLLLNVVISAGATYAVLTLWERAHPQQPGGIAASPTQTARPNSSAAAPSLAGAGAPAPTPTQMFIVYQVESGDTFASIANHFHVSIDELISVNGFSKDQVLGVGEALRIPSTPEAGPGPQGAASDAPVVIDNVVGPGDIDLERVVLRHQGGSDISLEGWRLEDENGNVFNFPSLELIKEDALISVYTKAGANTADSLYWGLEKPLWKSGTTVSLRDPQGTVQMKYKVP